MLRQLQQTAERAIAAHSDNAFQPQQLTGRNRLLLAFLRREFVAARRIENGAAPIDSVGHALFIQAHDVAGDQTVPASANAVALQAMIQRGTYNCADAGVHAGGIAAAGQHTDSTNTHMKIPPVAFQNLTSFYREMLKK